MNVLTLQTFACSPETVSIDVTVATGVASVCREARPGGALMVWPPGGFEASLGPVAGAELLGYF